MYGNSENEIERCVRFRRGWSISSQNTFLSTFLLTNQREILRYRVIHQKVINPSCIKIMFSLLFFSLEVKKTKEINITQLSRLEMTYNTGI